MSRDYEFIAECGVFYVLTVNGNSPAGRPFGAVMEYKEDLYISTANWKDVYKQLKQNENMQIIALRPGTREWVRISGKAVECRDLESRKEMLRVCPFLMKHFPTADSEHFALFKITERESWIYTDAGKERVF